MEITDVLLTAILIVLILVWLQGNRIGQRLGRYYDGLVYKRKTRRRG